jgi:phosphatidylglycerophosphate synthase
LIDSDLEVYFLRNDSQRALYQALFLWVILLAISVPLGLAVTLHFGPVGPLVGLTLFTVIGALVFWYLPRHHRHEQFGLANSVTLLRAALVSWLAGFIFEPEIIRDTIFAWSLMSAGFVVLLLDGVDGWLARKTGQSSAFGARFDMEIDSLFAIVLALLVWQTGKIGVWVLLLGLPRPVFVVAAWFVPYLSNSLPESNARKAICVIQIAALVVLLAPVFNVQTNRLLALSVLALLAWSFWRDTRWLMRNRATP